MKEQPQLPQNILFLKQYPCYDFALPPKSDLKVAWRTQQNFNYDNFDRHNLESICYDTHSANPSLYFVQWQDTHTDKNIYIKKQDEEEWIIIEMNQLPIRIKITDNCAFLIGSKQLIILPLEKQMKSRSIDLESREVVDIKFCFSTNRQSGLNIVYFDPKRGYYSQVYTKSTQANYWNKIVPYFNLNFSKFEPYEHLEVILPNILGLAIKNRKLLLFDLHLMKQTNLQVQTSQVIGSQKINIKWMLCQPNQAYDDTLNLFLCRKNIIQVFSINICRKSVKIQINGQLAAEKVQINRIIGGDIIDWSKTNIVKAQIFIETVSNIIDFEINQRQLIYSYFQPNQSFVPTTKIIYLYNSAKNASQVLSIENNIYSCFLENKHKATSSNLAEPQDGKKQILMNGKKRIQEQRNHLEIQNKYQFSLFLSIGNKFWSARRTSLTTFQPITELQFTIQRQNQSDNYLNSLENNIHSNHYALKKMEQKLNSYSSQVQINHFKDLIYELKRYISANFAVNIQENFLYSYISNNFYKNLVGTIVIDYLKHFNQYCDYTINVLPKFQLSQLNLMICKITSFLQDINYGQSLQLEPGHNFFSIFIDQIWKKLYNKQELSVCLVFNKILENLLHDRYVKYTVSPGKQNFLLELIVDLFIQYQEKQQATESLQILLKKYFKRLQEIQKDVFNFIVTQNSSVFMAFILSHPSKESIGQVFQVLFGKKHYDKFIDSLKKIKQFIPDQLQILLELQLNQGSKKLNYESFIRFAQTPLIFGSIVKKPCRAHLVAQMVLYNSEESFRQNLKLQKQLLAEIKQSNQQFFSTLNPKLADLSQKQLSIDILKQDYQHILEWQESILICYTNLFNQKLVQLENIYDNTWQSFKSYLLAILAQIQFSTHNYCKYYNLLYRDEVNPSWQQKGVLDGILQSQIISQQRAMSNSQLAKPLKIFTYILSHLAINVLKNLLNSNDAFRKIKNQKLISRKKVYDVLLLALRNLLKKQKLSWEDIDVLYFLLMKQGENGLAQLMRQFLYPTLTIILDFLKERKENGYLYSVIDSVHSSEEKIVQKYKNPFAVY